MFESPRRHHSLAKVPHRPVTACAPALPAPVQLPAYAGSSVGWRVLEAGSTRSIASPWRHWVTGRRPSSAGARSSAPRRAVSAGVAPPPTRFDPLVRDRVLEPVGAARLAVTKPDHPVGEGEHGGRELGAAADATAPGLCHQ